MSRKPKIHYKRAFEIVNPYPETSFHSFIHQFFYISLNRAFIESMASENASRLTAMQKAEENIEERLDNLNSQFNRQRQNFES